MEDKKQEFDTFADEMDDDGEVDESSNSHSKYF